MKNKANTIVVKSLALKDLVKEFPAKDLIFVGKLFFESEQEYKCVLDPSSVSKLEDGYKVTLKTWDDEVKDDFYIADLDALIKHDIFSVFVNIDEEFFQLKDSHPEDLVDNFFGFIKKLIS